MDSFTFFRSKCDIIVKVVGRYIACVVGKFFKFSVSVFNSTDKVSECYEIFCVVNAGYSFIGAYGTLIRISFL